MGQPKIRKGTFQHVESELNAYQDTKKEIARLRNELMGNGPAGRPAALIIKYKQLEQMQVIVDAIENELITLPQQKQDLLQYRYWDRPQIYTWDGIALRLNCDRRTALRWRDEVVAAVAARIGWR